MKYGKNKIELSEWTLDAIYRLLSELSRQDILEVLDTLRDVYSTDEEYDPEPLVDLQGDAETVFCALELLIDRDNGFRNHITWKFPKLPENIKDARRVRVCLDDTALRHLQEYALNKETTVSKAIDGIVYNTLITKGVAHIDFKRDRKEVKREPQWTNLQPATLALVENERDDVDYSTFIRGVVESFFGI